MNFSRVQNTVSFNTLVLLSVAVTESGDSSFIVNNKGSNKKTLFMNSTGVYMCINATDILLYWKHMQNSSMGAFLYVCQIFIFLFFLLCLHAYSSSIFLAWSSESYMLSISLWDGYVCLLEHHRGVCDGAGLSLVWPLGVTLSAFGGGAVVVAGMSICCCWFGEDVRLMLGLAWSAHVICLGGAVKSRSWQRLRR